MFSRGLRRQCDQKMRSVRNSGFPCIIGALSKGSRGHKGWDVAANVVSGLVAAIIVVWWQPLLVCRQWSVVSGQWCLVGG